MSQLFAEYRRIANMLGCPPCSDTHWKNIIGWLSEHVTTLAEWFCEQVQESVRAHGHQEAWVASYDGYYLTRGHHSNNSSATLYDYSAGNFAWFKPHTKHDVSHNWEDTSGGAEADMYDEILSEPKKAGFNHHRDSDGQGLIHECRLLSSLPREHNHVLQQPQCQDYAQGPAESEAVEVHG